MPDNRAATMQFLLGKGLTRAQAAGVVGSLMQESGLSTTAKNPSSGALGIGQWLHGRKTNLLASGKSGSLRGQLDFLWSELQGPERAALQRLKGAHTVADAAAAFTWGFERPGKAEANMANRVAQGQAALDLGGAGASSSQPRSGGGSTTTTTTTPGVDNSQARAQLVLSFLNSKSADPLDFASQFKALADVPGTSSTVTSAAGGSTSPSVGGSSLAQSAKRRADVIESQGLPYSWGGGHAGKTAIGDAVPLDCSGAVSKVLGIDPRVASQFKGWGRPGDGGNKGVTIAANDEHVLMKINGRWFGTSQSNPGGGAGWIDESQITPSYLSRFTLRHSNR